ncbi:E7 [Gammapapillomavirus sp.]|uniref:E7 n=1 Tax=Gammapapillomavirus sp. TaxID=2049444 RepID=UPI000C4AB2D8|nr:E7 [Gammapapillomavirus sp.]ATQ38176.1 E7 [Gammapapillomavirus sp.]
MHGDVCTIRDIELHFEDLVLPANLVSSESLSPDDVLEEERSLYKVDTYCDSCETGVRLFVSATAVAIRRFHQLLCSELSIICPGCARRSLQHGRF